MTRAADPAPGDGEVEVADVAPRSRIPLPPMVRGARRRSARRVGGLLPMGTPRDETRAALARVLETKGELRTSEALLVVVAWLERSGMSAVSASALRAVYPESAPPLGTMPHYLQHLVEVALLERVSAAVYRTTAVGRAVAEALPDRVRVKALRALRLTPPSPRRTPRSGHG